MERPELNKNRGTSSLANGSRPRVEENTGLFDIRTLAKVTKERISAQMETQSAQEALLKSATSSLSLSSISVHDLSEDVEPIVAPTFGTPSPSMLPTPEQEARRVPRAARGTDVHAILTDKAAGPAMPVVAESAMSEAFSGITAKKPTSGWVYAVAGVVILGAGGFFGYQKLAGGGSDDPAAVAAPVIAETAPAPAVAPLPKAEPLDEAAPDEVQDEVAPEPETAPADEVAEEAAAEAEAHAKAEAHQKKHYAREDSAEPKTDDSAARKAIDQRKLKEKAAAAPVVDTSDEKQDIDALLDQAASGKVLGTAKVEEVKKPTKTEITRRDVKSAMKKITSKAKGCYNLYEKAGTVMIKFEVAPSGKVTSAKATGSFAGSDTGSCVSQAVKRASFPAYDGAPMSFTYPFLLSP